MDHPCIWLTGEPSVGKTTLAHAVRNYLWRRRGHRAVVIDADEVRMPNLGFSDEDRHLNVRNIGMMARLVMEGGGIAVVACIAPKQSMRDQLDFPIRWVRLWAPQDVRMERDSRGLYARALSGEITGLTGYDAPYEEPPEARFIDTSSMSAEQCVREIVGPRAGHHAVFVGRWCPFHNGHKAIIDEALGRGEKVLVLVRDTDEHFGVGERIEMIRRTYQGNLNVKVQRTEDVGAVCIGRKVGYEVRRYEMPEHVEGISATKIREMIGAGNDGWHAFVPEGTRSVLCA